MHIEATPIAGVFVITAGWHVDDRGEFSRIFCDDQLSPVLGKRKIVQVNHSRTIKVGAIRGMHYQVPPHEEVKLVRCIKGRIFDVVLDLRHGSKTILGWHSEELTPSNNKMLIIPEGCAHGFQVMEENSELLYMHTAFYHPESEGGIRYNDPRVGIKWPLECSEISQRDCEHAFLDNGFHGIQL